MVVLDDLSSGRRELIPSGVPLVSGSIDDPTALDEAMAMNVSGVVHLAALKSVVESVEKPLAYFRINVGGTRCLLEAMNRHGVSHIVYSSSAAVYGDVPGQAPVTEEAVAIPLNPYGESKLVGEWLVRAAARAYGLSWTGLRYFNVAGAGTPELADQGTGNLVPAVIQAVMAGESPMVFGDDYPTRDGTCIRDYVHVADLAEAHVAALAWLLKGGQSGVYNVGTGRGASVLEVVQSVAHSAGRDIRPTIGARRPGDPASVIADTSRIARNIGWRAQFGIEEIVGSAWLAASSRDSL